jgi:hypothetical protein
MGENGYGRNHRDQDDLQGKHPCHNFSGSGGVQSWRAAKTLMSPQEVQS